ncbi:MAG: hypothetical protein JSU63_07000 [Phycisphaerales bacterium]|nr:MAG: hypothetical protein JSU63_07000 [Phycisphaerales bacterium]
MASELAWCAVWLILVPAATAQPGLLTLSDQPTDATPRRTDPGGNGPFDPDTHRLIELRRLTLGAWAPDDPENDLFTGAYNVNGQFLRLHLILDGLVNPPGNVEPLEFDPFAYGEHPIYGFVEIDMDANVWTGGELYAPEYRYLGNIVRFGGRVLRPTFQDRAALNGNAFDGDFLTPPFVERHGEEFHLALLGWHHGNGDIEEIVGDGDDTFDEGETWNIRGPFFHRAHGYEMFSFVEGGYHSGEYAPDSDLQFRHDWQSNLTHVSLVFPLTNMGAGLMRGEPPEPSNQNPTDHASILEALEDLQFSASFLGLFPTGLVEEDIIIDWAAEEPNDHLDPTLWQVTALLGTSYTQPNPDGVCFIWTDAYPDVARGDVNGSGAWDGGDMQMIAEHIERNDSSDGSTDEAVTILGFATDFSVYDVNHDGTVDRSDFTPEGRCGDGDHDGDVDLADFAVLQGCFARTPGFGWPSCRALDISGDERVDVDDVGPFVVFLKGPQTR